MNWLNDRFSDIDYIYPCEVLPDSPDIIVRKQGVLNQVSHIPSKHKTFV